MQPACSTEQQKEKYVKVALNKAERLEKLINELFEITKYNAHTVIIKKENIDLHCLIAQVIDEIYPTLSANGNTAVFTAEDNLSVNADPEKLARVFSNLLRNAASYSYPQTEIPPCCHLQRVSGIFHLLPAQSNNVNLHFLF